MEHVFEIKNPMLKSSGDFKIQCKHTLLFFILSSLEA